MIANYLAHHGQLRAAEWRLVFDAFDLLGQSRVTTDGQTDTFAGFYRRLIEDVYADSFIEQLLALEDNLVASADRLKATVARRIQADLSQAGLYRRGDAGAMYLLAFSYYRWDSFARGYIFEVVIFRDLEASGIEFVAHDITRRVERYSPADLIVLEQTGDIKTSTYFLHTARTGALYHDFYLTRLWNSQRRQRVRVVIMQERAWLEIDGDTVPANLDDAANHFPQPVRVRHDDAAFVIVDYEMWKKRVKARQQGGRQ